MKVITVDLSIMAINKDIALFNCDEKFSGVIHSTSNGTTTVILDGGYVLGEFDCPHCAVTEISLLSANISTGDKAGFGNYRSYKLEFAEHIFKTIH
ncbi:TPA: DNA breaking-rejoining protein [Escherichia coli]|uniref:DNA breaking-rejoining protein n=1 Tax=Escherichia coli TaxID=562 RepID=UPI0019BA1F59|nr:DNA breaking-rejoining protein [Escherichia coli]EGD6915848.1 DNA breaking-rejoining protein [Escherichia coli]EHM0456949.1 DNA breaking-rejoining protein [Escherichia coli]EHT5203038.1 DNA breaking-rejoining protein [Escherichia coli]EMB9287788.1 DNA breaking-rejoining protein [Escherichia coli]EME9731751.1 DNA breaking-rejoining protein [Escherichia coli]